MTHPLGHMGSASPRLVGVPALGQEQPPVDRAARLIGGGMHRDPDLAVGHLAQGARVLPGDPDRRVAVLGKAGVIDNPGVRIDHRRHLLREPLADRPPVPGALADELLQRLLVAVGEALGHGLDRLALAVQHQPTQIALTPAALIGARQRLEHLGGEGDQAPSRLGQLGRGHRVLTSTLSSSTMRRHCRGDSLRADPPRANLTEHYQETEVATAPRAWKAGAELLMATAILAHPEGRPAAVAALRRSLQPDFEARTE